MLKSLTGSEFDGVIKAQAHEAHDQKAQVQAHDQKQAQDPIQGLGGPMTRGRLKKVQEALQHKVAHLLEAQHADPHVMQTRLIMCIACVD